ncbi:MAG: hypothetical protein QGI68_10315 [Pseudomonadales bacterium]|jgi:hypothetical protein|nr:hypothetical protein [Pseudomonadales bacterium]MDP7144451.1 hypothetical protein [Pseudomonadales bacterium]MDP7359624.1 hypothetical protein [Pseudomonadales bacterium]MDP7595947.1 hypothetical protein [Pseudomonadales bacterium]HJN50890.1 hypothetical protein [Pseudomonadales bacterium]|tara:strand:+ start:9608 stop:10564 length:957 start_codon:yes stop_codon:yes gene_type:complete
MKFSWTSIPTIIVASYLLVACSNSGKAQLEGELLSTERRLQELEKSLNAGAIRNAGILRQYAQILTQKRPELASLLKELEKEGTGGGPVFKDLQARFGAVKDETEYFESWTDKVTELNSIQTAAQPSVFNDALSDTVNVIADMSGGELARVNAVSQQAEQQTNKSKNYGAGSQYIGNPRYGSWNHGSGGSVWAWYGQYAFFSSMFGGRRHYYNDWAGNRGYSYYHDVGRNSYTSPRQRVAQRDVQQRAKKQFGRSGKPFSSPYAKSRTGAKGISKASTVQKKSAFKSPYASSRANKSKFQSSTRASRSRTSRGSSRGK